MSKMNEIREIKKTLTLSQCRLKEAPGYDVYASIVAQLDYLLAVLDGSEKDRSKLKEIIIGHYAVRELGESDPELAQALRAAQIIANDAVKADR